MAKYDWPAVELLYFSSDLTLRELADKVGIPFGTIAAQASRKKWDDRKAALRRGELPVHLRPKKQPEPPESPALTASGDDVNTGIPGNREEEKAGNPGENDANTVCKQVQTKGRKVVTVDEMLENVQTVIANEANNYQRRMAKQAKRLPDIMEGFDDAALLAHADRLEKLDKLNRRTLKLDTEKQAQPLIQIDLLGALQNDPLASPLPLAESVPVLSTVERLQSEETDSQPALPNSTE